MKDITAPIEPKILTVRHMRVMLDSDLAALYQVPTSTLNQAVKRNIKRFPEDFMFRLTKEEWKNLKSQIVISSWGGRRKTKCWNRISRKLPVKSDLNRA